MNRPSNAVATRHQQWQVVIEDTREEFERLAQQSSNAVQFAREAQFALQVVLGSEYLQKCGPESIRNAVLNVAAVGITLNPAMKLAYLVPREGKACLDISYQGLVKIATDSGSVLAVKAEIVRERDSFTYHGPFSMPEHTFNPFAKNDARGPIVGAYTIAKLHNGSVIVDTLNMEEIIKIKNVSKARTGPWQQWEEQMIKKTAIKRGYKSWPKTERLSKAEAILNEHEGLIDPEIDNAPPLQRPMRQNAHEAAQRAAAPVAASAERDALVEELEAYITEHGLEAYGKKWAALTKEQRKLVGTEEHSRIKALGAQTVEAHDE